MSRWRLYAWGANSHGQLGLGFQSEQSTVPSEVDISSSELNIRDIKKIVGGGGHTLILDAKGRLFSCGSNDKGQTGFSDDFAKFIPLFQRVKSLDHEIIRDIECGWNSSMALTEKGAVYSWGSNSHGQLGIHENANIDPERVNIPKRIKSFSMGLRHSALITETGSVLTSGSGSKGQLGQLDENNRCIGGRSEFTEIAGLKDVVEVACGQNHSAALTASGEVYTWGDNKYGQLGIDNSTTKSIVCPTKVTMEEMGRWFGIQTGWTHTSILNDEGTIVAWGRNTYGQLGNSEKNLTWTPRSICHDGKFSKLSIGSEHNVGIADGSVYSWGWNEHGNCGNGSTRDVSKPEKVHIPCDGRAYVVGSGAGHSFAVVLDET